jgi:hypothetical protein
VGEFWIFGAKWGICDVGFASEDGGASGEERGKFGEVIIDEITTALLGSGGAVCLVGAYVYSVTFYSFFVLSSSGLFH